VLAGLALAFLLTRRIAGPLTRLADHVVEIRRSGQLDTRIDPSVADRGDEIGTLSRAFNLMIAELADARRRLIAWSEAEILKQYGRLDAAISNMPIGLCMFDGEQKLIIANNRYAEFYRLPPECTVPGTPFRTILEHTAPGHAAAAGIRNFIEERLTVLRAGEPIYFTNEMNDGRVIAEGSPAELKASIPGGYLLQLRFQHSSAKLAESLRQLTGVTEVRVNGDSVELYADRGGPLIPGIVGAASAAGAELCDVHISEPSLENLFLHHTGRSLRQ